MMVTLMQTCAWKSITKYTTTNNHVCKLVLSQTWSSACAIRYIQGEYESVDTLFTMSASVIKQQLDFSNICKNLEISHLNIMNL